MPTRNGKSFVNPPISERELRMRKKQAAKERSDAVAAAKAAAMPPSQAALTEPFVAPIVAPIVLPVLHVPAANPVLQTALPTKPPPKKKPKKPKKPKKTKKPKKLPKVVKRFPYGIPEPMLKSFNDFFEETCRVDFTNSGTRDTGLLMVGDVHKVYRAWCDKKKRPYCPERTSKQWNRAPFVVNAKRIDKMPPFRLLMFHKLNRLPKRAKDVFNGTETAWRRHKKNYSGWPFYQGLKYKDSFTPTVKYIRKKEESRCV